MSKSEEGSSALQSSNQPAFPLLLLIGTNPDAEKFFGLIDFFAESTGLYRKDLFHNWPVETSFVSLKVESSSVTADYVLSLALREWGDNCLENTTYSLVKVLPLDCVLLVIKQKTESAEAGNENLGYIANYFPKSGDFTFEARDFDFQGEQTYEQLFHAMRQVLDKYQSNYSPYRDSAIRFTVRFNNGRELQTFMSELMALSKHFGMKGDQFRGWETCQHGRHHFTWKSGWKLVKAGDDWKKVENGCADCNLS